MKQTEHWATHALRGALAGALATAPMTVAMEALFRQLPAHEQYPLPPSEITAKVTDDVGLRPHMDRQDHLALTLVAHFGYGAAVGALYGLLAQRRARAPIVSGIGYGLLVWTVSYLGVLPGMSILRPATEHPARRNALMIAAHIVWGAGVGLVTAKA